MLDRHHCVRERPLTGNTWWPLPRDSWARLLSRSQQHSIVWTNPVVLWSGGTLCCCFEFGLAGIAVSISGWWKWLYPNFRGNLQSQPPCRSKQSPHVQPWITERTYIIIIAQPRMARRESSVTDFVNSPILRPVNLNLILYTCMCHLIAAGRRLVS